MQVLRRELSSRKTLRGAHNMPAGVSVAQSCARNAVLLMKLTNTLLLSVSWSSNWHEKAKSKALDGQYARVLPYPLSDIQCWSTLSHWLWCRGWQTFCVQCSFLLKKLTNTVHFIENHTAMQFFAPSPGKLKWYKSEIYPEIYIKWKKDFMVRNITSIRAKILLPL